MTFRLFLPLMLMAVAGTAWLDLAPQAAFGADSPHATISFDVHKLEEENVEGPNLVRTYFTVGDQRMVFGVPKGCRLTAGNEFVLVPTDPSLEGEIHVRRSPFTPELSFVDGAAKYGEAVAGQIPQGAKDADVRAPVANPYPVNGWQSLGFVCTYTFYGRSFQRTVSYINLDGGAQVVVTTEGSPASAEKIEKMAHSFIGSWWVSKPATVK